MKYSDEKRIKNIVAFCTLMENHDGIKGKAPAYIVEKFRRYIGDLENVTDKPEYTIGLDSDNSAKVAEWSSLWFSEPEGSR